MTDFKTSHVIVYHTGCILRNTSIIYFKTSHVIVYRHRKKEKKNFSDISKHLMLLFIRIVVVAVKLALTFQNISCYCLSQYRTDRLLFCNGISKHLMLLFIWKQRFYYRKLLSFQNISCYCLSRPLRIRLRRSLISKHLMLLFIKSRMYQIGTDVDFKTSHVIVYLHPGMA